MKKFPIPAAVGAVVILAAALVAYRNLAPAAVGGERPGTAQTPAAASPTAGAAGARVSAAAGGAPASRGRAGAGVAVETATSRRGDLESRLILSGEVRAARSVSAYPDISGRIVDVAVSVGDKVRAGTVVARLDPSKPGSRYEASPVLAPISGTVTAILMEPGQNAGTTTAVLELATLDELEVVLSVPERLASALRTGQSAEIEIGGAVAPLRRGVVTSVSPILDPVSRSKEAVLRLVGRLDGVEGGMYAEARVSAALASGAMIVPLDALVRKGDGDVVFVVQDGVARERRVTVGAFTDAEAALDSGLEAGEVVITRGQTLLRDGSAVSVSGSGGARQ